jgi:predicted acyl esterase
MPSGRLFKRLGRGAVALVVAIIALGAITVAGAGVIYKRKAHGPADSGRDFSVYLRMADGVRIAVDVALPKGLSREEKIPALVKGTPYWRAPQLSFLGGAAAELGLLRFGEPDVPLLNARGYAVVTVDARGTGASFGHQNIMFDDAEVNDFGEIVDWAARQDWSNGRVGAYGFSYRGILATDMASLGRPALKAIAPSFDFPDLYLTAYPGGVLSERFIRAWSTQTAELNHGTFPCPFPCSLLFAGPRPVDSDRDDTLLAQAIAEHASNYDVYGCVRRAPNRDDKICASGKSLSDVSEISRRGPIESGGVPLYVVVGFLDANSAQQAIERYREFSNPQELVIGALSHGGLQNTDPFAAKSAPADPPYEKQISDMADFFDAYLKVGGKPITKSIRFHVLNGGGWRRADGWPPGDVKPIRLYLAADNRLSATVPAGDGSDRYNVDFTATTGIPSRYQSPVDLSITS